MLLKSFLSALRETHPSREIFTRHAGFLLVFLIAVLVYGVDYWNPASFFWDENYHIAAAQKYLHGIFFHELHPPLGKLLIAAGEGLLHFNERSDQFLSTAYATNPPEGFSFAGYRLFPVVFSILAALTLYEIFYLLFKKAEWAVLLTFLYLFDTALIVHSRGAMLEGIQICFVFLVVLSGLRIFSSDENTTLKYRCAVVGATFAAACTVKITSFFLLIGIVPLLYVVLRRNLREGFFASVVMVATFVVVYGGIWFVHFSTASSINTALERKGVFKAQDGAFAALRDHENDTLWALPVMVKDAFRYSTNYNEATPRLNLCKKDENGSPPYFWPFAARSINYRWDTSSDGTVTSYLYLQANPIVWLYSLLGVLSGGSLVFYMYFLGGWGKLRHGPLVTLFFALYGGYMAGVLQIDRVLYLYHYFIPLLIGVILFGLSLSELQNVGPLRVSERTRVNLLRFAAFTVLISFAYFRPLAYHEPLTNSELASRAWLKLWDLRCATCPRNQVLAFEPSKKFNRTGGSISSLSVSSPQSK